MSEEVEEYTGDLDDGKYPSESVVKHVLDIPLYEFLKDNGFYQYMRPHYDKPTVRANLSKKDIDIIEKGVSARASLFPLENPDVRVTLGDMIGVELYSKLALSQAKNGFTTRAILRALPEKVKGRLKIK